MIRLVKDYIDNGIDSCKECQYYEPVDFSAGITNDGCTHPILFDDEENIISAIELEIISCMSNPNQCCLYSSIDKK